MKFSIVTPSYNQGRYLPDCIESVKAQTGVSWEHLVIDAGSTDETLDVLRAHAHLKWVSEPDQGMSDGINRGFRKATGDWVMWLNTDDYLLPGALAKVAAVANRHPTADIIYGDCLFVDQARQPIRRKRDHRFHFGVLLFYGCYIASTSTFLKRRIITDGQLLDLDYKVCMDFEYYVRLALAGYRFEYLPEVLAEFRWHGQNTSTILHTRRRAERLQVQRKYLKQLGYGWLGRKWLLSVLTRVFQGRRILLRGWPPFGS
ncbi:MAG: glycosyltransferase [Verrucomicrobiae bacterium]|nr:glycosyltransferase [Verrucomicrobiae bacterium]